MKTVNLTIGCLVWLSVIICGCSRLKTAEPDTGIGCGTGQAVMATSSNLLPKIKFYLSRIKGSVCENDERTAISGSLLIFRHDDDAGTFRLEQNLPLQEQDEICVEMMSGGEIYKAVAVTQNMSGKIRSGDDEELFYSTNLVDARDCPEGSFCGESQGRVAPGEEAEWNLPLSHTNCRISVKTIKWRSGECFDTSFVKSFIVKDIFIMNAPRFCRFNAAASTDDISGKGEQLLSRWSEQGLQTDDSPGVKTTVLAEGLEKNLLQDVGTRIDCRLFSNLPYSGSDNIPYLVVKTEVTHFDGKVSEWFYRIALNGDKCRLERNTDYSFDISISGPGSKTPEEDVPKRQNVDFTLLANDWDIREGNGYSESEGVISGEMNYLVSRPDLEHNAGYVHFNKLYGESSVEATDSTTLCVIGSGNHWDFFGKKNKISSLKIFDGLNCRYEDVIIGPSIQVSWHNSEGKVCDNRVWYGQRRWCRITQKYGNCAFLVNHSGMESIFLDTMGECRFNCEYEACDASFTLEDDYMSREFEVYPMSWSLGAPEWVSGCRKGELCIKKGVPLVIRFQLPFPSKELVYTPYCSHPVIYALEETWYQEGDYVYCRFITNSADWKLSVEVFAYIGQLRKRFTVYYEKD